MGLQHFYGNVALEAQAAMAASCLNQLQAIKVGNLDISKFIGFFQTIALIKLSKEIMSQITVLTKVGHQTKEIMKPVGVEA